MAASPTIAVFVGARHDDVRGREGLTLLGRPFVLEDRNGDVVGAKASGGLLGRWGSGVCHDKRLGRNKDAFRQLRGRSSEQRPGGDFVLPGCTERRTATFAEVDGRQRSLPPEWQSTCTRQGSLRDNALSSWHPRLVPNWNKDDITDFAHELDQHRAAQAGGKLSDECATFLGAYMHRSLPNDQRNFFERKLLTSLLHDLKQIYDNNRADSY